LTGCGLPLLASLEESSHEPAGTAGVCGGVPAGVRVAGRLGALVAVPVTLRPVARPVTLAPGATRPAGLTVTDLNSVEQLQARFNADNGAPRLVLALAPT
jgi:hypothetical protein